MNPYLTALNRSFIDEPTKRALTTLLTSVSGVEVIELTTADIGKARVKLVSAVPGKTVMPTSIVCSTADLLPADVALDFGWGADADPDENEPWLASAVTAAFANDESGSVIVFPNSAIGTMPSWCRDCVHEKDFYVLATGEAPPEPPTGATITGFSPSSGTDGGSISITGTGLRPNAPAVGRIFIGDVEQARWTLWTQNTITFSTHQGALPLDTPQTLRVELADGTTVTAPGTFSFTAQQPMTVTAITPGQGADGAVVTVNGTDMGSGGDNAMLRIGTQEATVLAWSPNSISANAVKGDTPTDAPMVVTVTRNDGSEASAPTSFTFTLTKDLPKASAARATAPTSELPPARLTLTVSYMLV